MSEVDFNLEKKRLKIAIAGASGFVGRSLIDRLKQDFDVIALSRGPAKISGNIEWRQCDLFNLRQAEQGLAGADVVIYLVHETVEIIFKNCRR